MQDAKYDESACSHELAPQYRRDETLRPLSGFPDRPRIALHGQSIRSNVADFIHCVLQNTTWSVKGRLIRECFVAGLLDPR